MSAYRKKPVVIEAVEWTGTNLSECLAFLGYRPTVMPDDRGRIIIGTLEGTMKASYGDWIIRGVKGEFYPCKPDIFAATYDFAALPPEQPDPFVTVGTALPPDPAPTTREPCPGWRPNGTAADILPLDGDSVSDCRLWAIATNSRHGDVAWAVSMQSFDDDDVAMRIAAGRIDADLPLADAVTAAKLAAEDAADALLLAGRRALGRIR